MNGIILDENPNYNDVKCTIDALNENIEKDSDKYNYTGQSHHRLAYQYFTHNYDRSILSYCTPQIYDILTNKLCMNSLYTPTDEVKHFDGVIDTGLYYVETNNYFPLKGNG
jgi:hypothetical protein